LKTLELKGKHILVTGASGFLGGRIAEILCRNDCRVRALVRKTSDVTHLRPLPVELAVGELSHKESLERAALRQDVMIHCAGRVTDWGSRSQFFDTNVQGTRNLLEAGLGAGIKRVVMISSLTVLGLPRRRREYDELSPFDPSPEGLYNESKIEAERVAMDFRGKGLDVVIVRPAGMWGPGDPVFFPRLKALARRGWLCRIGKGDNELGMSYVDNVAEAVSLAIEAERPGPLYHIVDSESTTSAALMSRIAGIAGWKMRSFGVPYGVLFAAASLLEAGHRLLRTSAPPPLTRYGLRLFACNGRYNSRKAKRELGYEGRVGIEEGLRRLARWIGANGVNT
jgi:nucleoside-diphosphate-sugar epimerase